MTQRTSGCDRDGSICSFCDLRFTSVLLTGEQDENASGPWCRAPGRAARRTIKLCGPDTRATMRLPPGAGGWQMATDTEHPPVSRIFMLVSSQIFEGPFAITAAIASVAMLALYVVVEFVYPYLQQRKSKNPCKVHFTIRNSKQSISGRDVSQGDPHLVSYLVLPAWTAVDVELGFVPKIPIYISELVIGCRDKNGPDVTQRFDSFKKYRKTEYLDDYTDVNGAFHLKIERRFNAGSHFVSGLKVTTKQAGTYPVSISFMTDSVESNYEGLAFIVEVKPKTNMSCHAPHHGAACSVSPIGSDTKRK